MTMLNWGLVGLGGVADLVATALAGSRNGRAVACSSRTLEGAERFGRKHGIDRVYATYEDLVRDAGVDAVYVATPNNLHTPVVLAAAAAGKQVLCEKPMAPTVAEAERMIAACREAGVMLRLGFYLRFLRVLQEAAVVVRSGRLGTLREVTTQRFSGFQPETMSLWRRDMAQASAGVLADVAVHLLDYVQLIVGDRIERVFALATPRRSTGQTDHTVTVLVDFAGGCQASIRASRGMTLGANDLEIFGSGGMLSTGPLRWTDVYRMSVRTHEGAEDREFPVEDLYRLEVEAFADELEGLATPLATGEDGLRMVRVAVAAIRSLETGAAVPVEG